MLSVRYDPHNAFSHCFSCHELFDENPADFTAWAKVKLDTEFDILQIRARQIMKMSKPEREELYQEMKAELERMEGLRKQGYSGRIEFELMRQVAA